MRISMQQQQLLKKLQLVEHVVNDRNTLPILSNILLQITNNELQLTATDLDVGIRCQFQLMPPCESGAVALPARKLTTIIRELPDDLVTLEAKKNHTATIHCAATSFRVPGLPAEDFPVLPAYDTKDALTTSQAALKQLISQTSYAMSMEESRFILNGALLTSQKNALTVVATDGRRLACANSPISANTKQQLHAVIPAKAIRELGRLLDASDQEEVRIMPLKDNQLAFQFNQTTIITRLIEGQFPPYEKVIPAPSRHILRCNKLALSSAIRRASLMTTATSQAITFELSSNRVVVSKESAELGSAREEVEATYSGEDMSAAFNPEFWLDILKILDSDEVAIELSGPDRPAVLRQPDFVYVVLPMRVS